MQLIDRRQRRKQRPQLERRFASAADQLEDLYDKFDFADPARTELDIVLQPATTNFTGNHPLHVTQRLDHAEVDVATEDERPQHGAQFVGVGAFVIAHDPRFDHRVALPVAPLFLIVIFQRGKAQHQRPAVAEGTQAHINAINKAILRRLIENFNQPLAEAGKELSVIQLAAPAAG